MVRANYKVIIRGQLRHQKTLDQVVKTTGRWIRFIDDKSEYNIDSFAGLFVIISWFGSKIDIRRIDTMMNNIRRNSPFLFLVSEVTIFVEYLEKGG